MQRFKIELGHNIAGNEVAVNGYHFGTGAPTVYIQGGLHGGEITYWIFRELVSRLKENELLGQITLIPICNPHSWDAKHYFYTAGKFSYHNGSDWNSHFPGETNDSTGAQLAKALFGEASKHKLVIDLHTSRESNPFGIYVAKQDEELMKVLGLKYNQFMDEARIGKKGTLSHTCARKGLRSIAIECGRHDSFNRAHIEACVSGLINLLKFFKVLEGKMAENKNIFVFEKNKTYYAEETGFVDFVKKPDETYKKGDVLFVIYSSNDLLKTIEVKAEEDGVIMKLSPTHIYQQGHPVIQVIENSELREI